MVATGVYLIVFGGFSETPAGKMKYHNDLHVFDLLEDKWLNANGSGAQPAPRSGFLFWASADGRHCFCSGGTASSGEWLSDTWVLDLLAMTWTCAFTGSVTPPRNGMSLLQQAPDSSVLVFGGITEREAPKEDQEAANKKRKKPKMLTTFHGDLRVLSCAPAEAESWRSCAPADAGAPSPLGRMHAVGVQLGEIGLVYGGLCETGHDGLQEVTLDDLWAVQLVPAAEGAPQERVLWRQLQGLSEQVGVWFDPDSSSGDDEVEPGAGDGEAAGQQGDEEQDKGSHFDGDIGEANMELDL